MDGNPEGTPNPLNPTPGTASAASQPQPSVGTAAGTGTPANYEPVKPASFAQDAEHVEPVTGSSMPEMSKAEPASAMPNIPPARPAARVNQNVVDPMMRPVSHSPKPVQPAINATNFDTLEMDNVSLDELSSGFNAPASEPNLVAKDSVVEPAGHKGGKKKGLIIGAIVLIMVAIICGAAAIAIVLLNNGDDKVTKAIDKLINGQVSSIVAAQGSINIATDSDESNGSSSGTISASNISIDFDGTFDTASSMSEVSASIGAEFNNGGEATLDIDELSTKDGSVFLKIGGISSILEGMYPITIDTTEEAEDVETNCLGSSDMNCDEAEEEDEAEEIDITDTTDLTTTSGLLSIFSGMFDVIDDQWILVSSDFTESMEELELFDNDSTCLINAFGSLPKYASDIANKYKANQFITYSTDKLEIAKRKNSLYRLGFDEDKLADFVNSLRSSGFANELNACAGNTASNSGISVDEIKDALAGFPTLYVEIDDNNNFTRVYFKNSTMTADINLSYPSELKITEPEDYIDLSTAASNALVDLFTTDDSIVVEGTIEEEE